VHFLVSNLSSFISYGYVELTNISMLYAVLLVILENGERQKFGLCSKLLETIVPGTKIYAFVRR